jgi:hypothetical protein
VTPAITTQFAPILGDCLESSLLRSVLAEDHVKQNAIYVDVDKSCRVKNSATNDITREDAAIEYERASRYGSIVARLLQSDAYEGLELRKLKDAMKVVFWQKYKPISEIG